MESSSSSNNDVVQLGFSETPRKGDFDIKNFPSKIGEAQPQEEANPQLEIRIEEELVQQEQSQLIKNKNQKKKLNQKMKF